LEKDPLREGSADTTKALITPGYPMVVEAFYIIDSDGKKKRSIPLGREPSH